MALPVWVRAQLTVIGVVPTLDEIVHAPERSCARAMPGVATRAAARKMVFKGASSFGAVRRTTVSDAGPETMTKPMGRGPPLGTAGRRTLTVGGGPRSPQFVL